VTVSFNSQVSSVMVVRCFGVKMALTLLLFPMIQFTTLTTQRATSKTLAYFLTTRPIRLIHRIRGMCQMSKTLTQMNRPIRA
ncbi:hypothetical protein D047_4023B, partial [Vibrio parahaemolyticus VPTS-2010_2]